MMRTYMKSDMFVLGLCPFCCFGKGLYSDNSAQGFSLVVGICFVKIARSGQLWSLLILRVFPCQYTLSRLPTPG